MKTLLINACVRENSRTLTLTREIMKEMDGETVELRLEQEDMSPLGREALEQRERLLREGRLDDPALRYARQFAEADRIVIAAPFWDLSFPSLLKIYLEQICVAGLTFEYRMGRPFGLCKAQRLIYVTTAGGPIITDFGYAYVKALANQFFGIHDTISYRCENLDVACISAERLLREAEISVLS